MGKEKLHVEEFILNCVPSLGTENDWTFGVALSFG